MGFEDMSSTESWDRDLRWNNSRVLSNMLLLRYSSVTACRCWDEQYIEGEGQWEGDGGWSNQREGGVGGAIRTLYRRGGTVGGDGGWSNQSSIWEGVVGGAIRTLYGTGVTVGGDGGWSNQSSIWEGWWVEQSKGGGGGWSNQNIV